MLAFVHDATAGHARSRYPGDDDALVWAMRERTSELAVATAQPEARLSSELAEAVVLHESFPETANAFHRGSLSLAHVRAITGPGARIPTRRARTEYQRTLLGPAHHLTPARLRARAARLAEEHLPESMDERHAHAAGARGVHVRHEHDGMSRLEADLPTVLAAAIHNRLTAQARALTGPDESRTLHQLRADVFSELLLTSDLTGTGSPHAAASGISARIAITVPVLSLLDHTTTPALLDGLTPVPLKQARALTAHAPSWLRVLTDPITGTTREVDTRHPTAAQRALLHARDHHCRFPGCTRPAPRCDIDHTVAVVDGGATHIDNMEHLCRPHHTLKHHTRWRVRQHPGGHLDWTSPTGHTYTDDPRPTTTHIRRTNAGSDEPPPASPRGPRSGEAAVATQTLRTIERVADPGRGVERERERMQPRGYVPELGSPPGHAFGVRPRPVLDPADLGDARGSTGAALRDGAQGSRARRAGPRFEPSDDPPPF
nr:HNH endonuclease signature motif containing protein [Pseudoclavibacter chungangensis]